MLKLNHEFMFAQPGSDIHFYVSSDDPENDQLKISIVSPNVSQTVDVGLIELIGFRDIINNAIEDAFKANEIRCPACGYSADDAALHGDHRVCRRFPFFPGEVGETQAVSR